MIESVVRGYALCRQLEVTGLGGAGHPRYPKKQFDILGCLIIFALVFCRLGQERDLHAASTKVLRRETPLVVTRVAPLGNAPTSRVPSSALPPVVENTNLDEMTPSPLVPSLHKMIPYNYFESGK